MRSTIVEHNADEALLLFSESSGNVYLKTHKDRAIVVFTGNRNSSTYALGEVITTRDHWGLVPFQGTITLAN